MLLVMLAVAATTQPADSPWRQVFRRDYSPAGYAMLSYDPASVRHRRGGRVRVRIQSQWAAGTDSLPVLIEQRRVEIDCPRGDGRVLRGFGHPPHEGLTGTVAVADEEARSSLVAALCR